MLRGLRWARLVHWWALRLLAFLRLYFFCPAALIQTLALDRVRKTGSRLCAPDAIPAAGAE
jgi:hypothetical protein